MGDVYVCLDRKLKREVALKLIKPEHCTKPVYKERFRREIEAAIALEGCDVVRIYDQGECPLLGAPYYVMEYLRGHDLREELLAYGRLEAPRALELLIDVCAVVAAAHEHNIIHRDLKPSNLFLQRLPTPKCCVRVLDFGIARVLESTHDGELTQLGGQPGSPNYMSPEQHVNDRQVGAPADIWALGAILYEMVVGEQAWPGDAFEASRRIIAEPARRAKDSCPELPAEFDRIIQKCLEKRPADRYASANELSQALEGLLPKLRQAKTGAEQAKAGATLAKPGKPRASRRWHRSPVVLFLSGVCMLLALGGAVVRPRHEVAIALPYAKATVTGVEYAKVPLPTFAHVAIQDLSPNGSAPKSVGSAAKLVGEAAPKPVASTGESKDPNPSSGSSTAQRTQVKSHHSRAPKLPVSLTRLKTRDFQRN